MNIICQEQQNEEITRHIEKIKDVLFDFAYSINSPRTENGMIIYDFLMRVLAALTPLLNKPASNSESVLPAKPEKHEDIKIKELIEYVNDKLSKFGKRLGNLEKTTGALFKDEGEKNEKAIRLLVANVKGEDYSKSVRLKHLIDAVENISLVSGSSNVDQKSTLAGCKKVVNYLKDQDIYKKFLRWFYDQVKKRAIANNNTNLQNILNSKPWVLDDVLSLSNVKESIPHLDQDLKESLKFLENGVMWENPEFVSSSSGHGLVLAMFASVYQTCPDILSFPPAAEIEQDCKGKIAIQSGTVYIEIGEIKLSKKGVPYAKKQLKRSLLNSKWLHQRIHGEQYEYKLIANIFLTSENAKIARLEIKPPEIDEELIEYTIFEFPKSEEGSATNMA